MDKKNKYSKKANGKNMTGAPDKYKPEFNKQVAKLCKLGSTDKEISDFFEISEATLTIWKKKYPKFLASIKAGKVLADANVANRLYQRALGYKCKEDKIFIHEGNEIIVPTIKHYPPDPTAAIFWLKNRQPKIWRDKQEIDHTTKGKEFKPSQIKLPDGSVISF